MQRDLKIRGYVVAQFPNPPLWVAFAAALVRFISPSGAVDAGARGVFYVAMTVWAWQEASDGVNAFRRVLGGVALALIALLIARELE